VELEVVAEQLLAVEPASEEREKRVRINEGPR
jgi:hypothetical protein